MASLLKRPFYQISTGNALSRGFQAYSRPLAASAQSPQEELKSGIDPSKSSESAAESPPTSKDISNSASSPSSESSSSSNSSGNASSRQTYPLYPSVAQLLHEKAIPTSEAEKIPATGPKGRLLKGDVLAYIGNISSSYASDQSARISKLAHLDLSAVKIIPPKKAEPSTSSRSQSSTAKILAPEPDTEVAVTISLKAVREVQNRLQSTLGVVLPLSTFVARAAKAANRDLPRASTHTASADDLFNQILGLDAIRTKTSSHGTFTPQIIALPTASSPLHTSPTPPTKQPDILDQLIASQPSPTVPLRKRGHTRTPPTLTSDIGSDAATAVNIFSVNASKGEEKRARVFLERVKTLLQVEPGTLIL